MIHKLYFDLFPCISFLYSAIALCKLLQFTIETNDMRLQTIEVKGELVINKSTGVKTRSKASKGLVLLYIIKNV